MLFTKLKCFNKAFEFYLSIGPALEIFTQNKPKLEKKKPALGLIIRNQGLGTRFTKASA